jgi:excisionase family DNA binding protein
MPIPDPFDFPLSEAPTGEAWLPILDVCEQLSVSKWTVRRLIRAGELDAIRLQGFYRVSSLSLARFIEDSRVHLGDGDA